MKDHNPPDKPKYFLKRDQSCETEQQRLEREVLAAGGRVGRSEGRFNFGLDEAEGYKRGDEHRWVEGLFFYRACKGKRVSRWASGDGLADIQIQEAKRKKKHYEENKEEMIERIIRWRENNPEKVVDYKRKYKKNNPEKVKANDSRRRARKLEAFDPSANQAVIDSRYAAEEYLNTVTGCDWHVDHTQPLSLGGKEHENNMQVVPAKWNCSKGNHHCDRWIEDSDIYRYATAVEARFEREAKKNEKKVKKTTCTPEYIA